MQKFLLKTSTVWSWFGMITRLRCLNCLKFRMQWQYNKFIITPAKKCPKPTCKAWEYHYGYLSQVKNKCNKNNLIHLTLVSSLMTLKSSLFTKMLNLLSEIIDIFNKTFWLKVKKLRTLSWLNLDVFAQFARVQTFT